MRRRASFALLVAAVIALLIPSSAAAYNPFEYTVLKNVCRAYGGVFGWGYAVYKVKLKEYGVSGTTQFQTVTYLQRKVAGTWQTVEGPWTTYSTEIADDWQTYNWKSRQRNDFGPEAATYYHRLATHIEFWGYGTLLSKKWLYGRSC